MMQQTVNDGIDGRYKKVRYLLVGAHKQLHLIPAFKMLHDDAQEPRSLAPAIDRRQAGAR